MRQMYLDSCRNSDCKNVVTTIRKIARGKYCHICSPVFAKLQRQAYYLSDAHRFNTDEKKPLPAWMLTRGTITYSGKGSNT